MLKDYVNDFAKVVIGKTDIYIQDYSAYEIPKSAVYKKDDETMIDTVTKGYFSDSLPVVVEKYNNGNAVLRTVDNPKLSSGMRISIYP